ncbi:hypothetical protein BDV27DRAFT_157282 [Aspergillus caelatus]|uniref:Uncharacterized protein n=1 Tax=Aspergillus caelatus TaxID=61420 RepID=A0A5N7A5F5_9EURO|nr:uncharacterized protein BDV27DRAFT_157282 [Aspergillus caelatus]KAE8365087.1 hypothetical protein BDV27DRAFT_157282 [Aspergillus caelatus]
MPATLPLELLSEIARIPYQAGDCLVPYTTRRCPQGERPKRDFSGSLQKATAGSGVIRRIWIRKLQYDILVPFELLDWTHHKDEGYNVDNPVREANDQAFQTAMAALFETLSSWDQSYRLSLELGLLSRQMGEEHEPHTWYFEDAGEYRYDYKYGREMSVPPYRGALPQ